MTIARFNDDVVLPGEPPSAIVDVLRDLLAQAERNEIHAIAVTAIRPNGIAFSEWRIAGDHGYALLGVVTLLAHNIAKTCE